VPESNTGWDAQLTGSGSGPEFTTAFRSAIERTCLDFCSDHDPLLAPLGGDARRLGDAARRSVSGGKRFRAAFCWWGHRAAAGTATVDSTALLRACAALEFLHASALVHDDYIDASDVRRGRPAIHRAFADEHQDSGWTGDSEQYGAAAAILLGDLLLSWAD
jgi:geranylgeranyl diphosphate synthase type I